MFIYKLNIFFCLTKSGIRNSYSDWDFILQYPTNHIIRSLLILRICFSASLLVYIANFAASFNFINIIPNAEKANIHILSLKHHTTIHFWLYIQLFEAKVSVASRLINKNLNRRWPIALRAYFYASSCLTI